MSEMQETKKTRAKALETETSESVEVKTPVNNTENVDADNFKQMQDILKAQQANMDLLTQVLTGLAKQISAVGTQQVANDKVKIVHLVQRGAGLKTIIQLSNLTIAMENLGEERTVTLQQFEEMVGKYRTWFTEGIISLANGYEEIAETYGIKTAKKYPLTQEFLNSMADIDIYQVEEVFKKLPKYGQETLCEHWIRKVIDKDPKFMNMRKLEVLNRITDGAFGQLISEIQNR